MTTEYRPFRVLMQLRTPIIVGEFPTQLDGLLSYAIYAHTGMREPGQIHDYMAKNLLQYNEELRVFHGSALALGVTNDWALLQDSVTRVGKPRQEELSSWYFKPNGKGGKYTTITMSGGPTKSRLDTYKAISAPYAVFWGLGDQERVVALLRHYVWSLGVLGMSGTAGEVGTVSARPEADDQSLAMLDGKINRNLPAGSPMTTGQPETNGRLGIPYHSGPNMAVVAPTRIRKTII